MFFFLFFSFGILSPRRHWSSSSSRGTRRDNPWRLDTVFEKTTKKKIPEIFRDLISIGNFKNFFHFASVCRLPTVGDTSGLSGILSSEIFSFLLAAKHYCSFRRNDYRKFFFLFIPSLFPLGDIDSAENGTAAILQGVSSARWDNHSPRSEFENVNELRGASFQLRWRYSHARFLNTRPLTLLARVCGFAFFGSSEWGNHHIFDKISVGTQSGPDPCR